jgi:hypothetical protein
VAAASRSCHYHRIEHSDKRRREQADRSLKVGGRRTDQLGEISHRANAGLGAPSLSGNPGFLDLQAGEGLRFALAFRNNVSAIAALLVSDRHRTDRAAKSCRFVDGRVDLSNASIEVGGGLVLDDDVSGFCPQAPIDSRHMVKVGAREKAEHADRVLRSWRTRRGYVVARLARRFRSTRVSFRIRRRSPA